MSKRDIRKWATRQYRSGVEPEPKPKRWWHWVIEIALALVLLYIVANLLGVIGGLSKQRDSDSRRGQSNCAFGNSFNFTKINHREK